MFSKFGDKIGLSVEKVGNDKLGCKPNRSFKAIGKIKDKENALFRTSAFNVFQQSYAK